MNNYNAERKTCQIFNGQTPVVKLRSWQQCEKVLKIAGECFEDGKIDCMAYGSSYIPLMAASLGISKEKLIAFLNENGLALAKKL